MKKIVTIIGARPQIIKSAALSNVLKKKYRGQIQEVLVHTGQHYSESMSNVFFQELGLSLPDYNLEVGSASHGIQTADMIKGLEEIFLKERPKAVVVYGDTNSTLAAAIAASKIYIPIVHIEAGLRSFDKSMPEEINRILCDHTSTLLFSPTIAGVENLKKEGFSTDTKEPYSADNPKVYHCGDIMYDNHLYYSQKVNELLSPYELMTLQSQNYFLCTVHRPDNTDNPTHLREIFEAFLALMEKYPKHLLYLPLHPRTQRALRLNMLEDFRKQIEEHERIKILPPVSYVNMIALQQNCDLIITDSGGLQKEAYFANKLSVILRNNTEWTEIVENDAAILTGWKKESILDGIKAVMETIKIGATKFPPIFGNGNAAEFIADEIHKICQYEIKNLNEEKER